MSTMRNPRSGPTPKPDGDRSVILAMKLLARWRQQGFDMVMCHPKGYCSPVNSAAMRSDAPEGYGIQPIDSDDALASVTASVRAGTVYRI
jgi:hypothetical protein